MATKSAAAEAIRRLAVQYQQMTEAADLLESIGSMEGATKEARDGREVAEKERDAVREDIKKAKADLKVAQEKAKLVIAEAESGAVGVEQSAQDAAIAIRAMAEADAAAVLAIANEQAMSIIANAEAAAESERQATIDLTVKHATLNDLIADAEGRLGKVNKQLDTTRSKLAALLGE